VRLIKSAAEMERVQAGDVLVTDMTDPDWGPVMKRAAAIVTNRADAPATPRSRARVGHPVVVVATRRGAEGQRRVTVSCAEGDTGHVYEGLLEIEVAESRSTACRRHDQDHDERRQSRARVRFSKLPNEGVGLARLEFIINRNVGVHPGGARVRCAAEAGLKTQVAERTAGYPDPVEFYVAKIAEGVATIAAAFWPKKVIVRLSDFKSNEYSNLLAGDRYEPHEENPMIGFRGASRYIAPEFYDCFQLECRALKRVRDDMGFTNVEA
jgi:pyruvate,water dikinase